MIMEVVMYVKYLGRKKDFKYQKYDFSSGVCEMPDKAAEVLIATNPRGFVEVMPQGAKSAKPAIKKAVKMAA